MLIQTSPPVHHKAPSSPFDLIPSRTLSFDLILGFHSWNKNLKECNSNREWDEKYFDVLLYQTKLIEFFCAVVQSDIWNETRSSSTKVATRDPYCCVASPLQQATGWSVTVDYLTYLFLWSILYVEVNETYET